MNESMSDIKETKFRKAMENMCNGLVWFVACRV
jgi:hypothetical protein